MQEEDGPEAALAKLLAGSAGDQGAYPGGVHRSTLALQGVPSEQQLEVQRSSIWFRFNLCSDFLIKFKEF